MQSFAFPCTLCVLREKSQMGSKWVGKGQASSSAKAESSLLHVAFLFSQIASKSRLEECHEVRGVGEEKESRGEDSVSWEEMGGWRSGERKGDVLIVDGSGADSCNDLICLCAWRWKDRTPPERIAPSFSVNRVNYLYNEICKVVNFSSSLFLPSQLFTLPRHFLGPQLISVFVRFLQPPLCPSVRPKKKPNLRLLQLLHQLTSLARILEIFAQRSALFFLPSSASSTSLLSSVFIFPHLSFPSTPLPPLRSTSLIAVLALSLF